METKKITIGCFVGGVIGTIVALFCAPLFWWLGMLAGFCVGYLCYDLKEVFVKIPTAGQYAVNEILPEAKEILTDFFGWVKKPHPFLLVMVIFIFALWYPAYLFLISNNVNDHTTSECLMVGLGFSGLISTIFVVALLFFVEMGCSSLKFGKKCYFFFGNIIFGRIHEKTNKVELTTNREIYFLALRGILVTICVIGKGIPIIIEFFGSFLRKLLKLIYSHKRILCGIDSAIGVFITYFIFGIRATTLPEMVVTVICGGIIGAAIGVLNYELISKRLLHLTPA